MIVVTGSVGKTTLLRMIEQQLGDRAHYSHKANSVFGIPFDIVGLDGVVANRWRWLWLIFAVPLHAFWFSHKQEYYVAEVDASLPREAELVSGLIRPEVTLWVSLSRSHAGSFDKQVAEGKFSDVDQAIAHEFGYLARNASNLVVIVDGNHLMEQQTKGIKAKVENVSLKDLKNYKVTAQSTQFDIGSELVDFGVPMPREVALQVLMLEKLVRYIGDSSIVPMTGYVPAPGRNSFFEGKNGLGLIDSSYNAHVISMQSMLEMMEAIDLPVKSKWLVIGDMTEQGLSEETEHKKLGEILASTKVGKYVLVGRRVSKYVAPILTERGMGDKTEVFSSAQEALSYIEQNATNGETILFKGSQYLEWIVEKLLENPENVKDLARQDEASKSRRASWGLR